MSTEFEMPEYRGATLGEAIRAALAPERARREALLVKRGESCTDLLFDVIRQHNRLSSYSDELKALERQIESLRESARRAKRDAALSLLGGALGSVRRVIRAVRKLRNKSVKDIEISDIENFLAIIGPIGAVISLRDAFEDEAEARRLEEKIENIVERGRDIGSELKTALQKYDRAGCNAGTTGTS